MRAKWTFGLGLGAFASLLVVLSTVASGATIQGTDVKVTEDALSEVTIDVNPTNGNNLVIAGHEPGGFENMNTYFTTDGGANWTAVDLGDAGDGLASNFRFDPAVSFDGNGNTFVAYGATDGAAPLPNTTVVVARSTNGGSSYTTFRQLATNPRVPNVPGNDRWTFASGPGPGGTGQRTYLAWTRNVDENAGAPVQLDQQIVVSSTSDGGNTWSAPVIVNDGSVAGSDAGNLTALPAVGPDGDLYLVWHDIGGNQIMFDRSTDGGVTWGTDSVVTGTGVGFLVSIPPQNERGVGPLGALAADRSGGANDDRIYLAYLDTGTGGMPNTDVVVRTSDNDGGTWSAPTTVNDDGGTTSQFLPWLTVDQETGLVAAVWYDARLDANNRAVNVYSAVSNNGGGTWDANVRVSDTASDVSANNPGSYGGDFLEYIGVTAQDCRLVPVWADNSETADGNAATADDFDYFVDRLTITGGLCNSPPTVSAGGPYTTPEGTNVQVTATGNDADGDTITYSWDLDNNGSFETSGNPATFDRVGQDGSFTIVVRADDGKGGVTTASTTVNVTNVAPTVTIANNGPKSENTAVTVSGVVSDAGFEETPLTASIDWGDGAGPQPLSGTVEGDRPFKTITYSANHTYGDDGVFTVTVCAADDDTSGNCSSTNVTITNTKPTATIDESGTVVVNGMNVILTNAGASNAFSGTSSDPGSDDLTFTWNWDDGTPNTATTYFANAPVNTPDPDPSPDVNPRVNVIDSQSHTFGSACLYDVQLTVADDDGGSAVDSVKVIVTGNAGDNRTAGYWFNQYKQGPAQALTNARLACYLDIVELLSAVFSEKRAAGTFAQAADVLKATAKEGVDALDRQLLAAWLNLANGGTGPFELVDTNGDGTVDTPFLTVLANAEAVRTNAASTRAALLAQYTILERINRTP